MVSIENSCSGKVTSTSHISRNSWNYIEPSMVFYDDDDDGDTFIAQRQFRTIYFRNSELN